MSAYGSDGSTAATPNAPGATLPSACPGFTLPTPGSGAYRLCQPMSRLCRSCPAATRHSGAPALSGRPGPRAARAGRRATRRSSAGTGRVSRCWRSRARWAWRGRSCVSSPGPTASQSAPRAAPVRASSILFCPTSNAGWPQGVRTALFCGASCVAWVSRAGASRSTAGSPSGGRCQPGSGDRGRRTLATDKQLQQAKKRRPCQGRGNSPGTALPCLPPADRFAMVAGPARHGPEGSRCCRGGPGRTGQRCRDRGGAGTPVHCARARLRRQGPAGEQHPDRTRGRVGLLADPSACVRRRRHRDIRRRTGYGRVRSARCTHRTLE